MDNITSTQVKDAILAFLDQQFEKKAEPERKALAKLDPEKDSDKVSTIRSKLEELKQKYQKDSWMDDAALRMAKQLRFGTHISKGVHPDSKGDNVNYKPTAPLPAGLVGSQTIANLPIDANGNAAALPLAAFFEFWVDETKGIKLRDLIQIEHPATEGVFNADSQISQQYAEIFKSTLINEVDKPTSHERNKQVLWPLANAINDDHYRALIPLHPSALLNVFFQRINHARFSEANKLARDNRNKKTVEQQPYLTIPDIGVIQLGGTKPQNISQLVSKQSGRNFLLSSMPPISKNARSFHIKQGQKSVFGSTLFRLCNEGFMQLYGVVEDQKNNHLLREKRKKALDSISSQVLLYATHIQTNSPPGWSKDHDLEMPEKYWLDPNRAQLEDEQSFTLEYNKGDWQNAICQSFALWVNQNLKRKFENTSINFGDDEYKEWMREMQKAIKDCQRNRKGAF